MQAHVFLEVYFRQAKIVFFTLLKIIYPLLLPSHNCINNNNVQFSRCIFESLRDSMKFLLSKELQSISFMVEISGIEPLTSCLQGRRSPSWAKPPYNLVSVTAFFRAEPWKRYSLRGNSLFCRAAFRCSLSCSSHFPFTTSVAIDLWMKLPISLPLTP